MEQKIFIVFSIIILAGCAQKKVDDQPKTASLHTIQSYNQIHVLADGGHFTSLLYDTTLTQPNGRPLMKPILYPVYSPSGIRMQRQYPLKNVNGESQDHSHHEGIFFTYGADGEVNGNSFWQDQQGATRIRQVDIEERKIDGNKIILSTQNNWIGSEGGVVVVEDRKMIFSGNKSERAIDFTMEMRASDEDVTFKDTKEGMFGIRVADWLSEQHGNGMYLSSKGDTTSRKVWGERAQWVRLEGHRQGKDIGIIIMNHPSSVNYPTFWHARDYGLFTANPLGQAIYQEAQGVENPDPLNYTIPAGDKGVFKFKMIIYEGHYGMKKIEKYFKAYSS